VCMYIYIYTYTHIYIRILYTQLSRFNSAEADEVVRVVNGFLAAGMAPGDIGVVTPYAAQVRHIRRLFPRVAPGERGVEVSSVDGFQGREKEVSLSFILPFSLFVCDALSRCARVFVHVLMASRALS